MKLRLFGPGGRVWRLAFRIKHTAKSLKYRQLYNIRGGGGGGVKIFFFFFCGGGGGGKEGGGEEKGGR